MNRLVRALAWMVAESKRREWVREWEAEFARSRARRGTLWVWAAEDAMREFVHRVLGAGIWREGKQAGRVFFRAPGYAVAVVMTLALGIGATTLVWCVVDTYLVRPLPLSEPGRVVAVFRDVGGRLQATSAPNYLDMKEQVETFQSLSALQVSSATLTDAGAPQRVSVARVTPDFFSTAGIDAALGRVLDEGDVDGGGAVISHDLWSRAFGADPAVLGGAIRLDGQTVPIVGVLPRQFRIPPFMSDVWIPLAFSERVRAARSTNIFYVMGRLRTDATLDQAQADLNVVASHLAATWPDANEGARLTARPIHDVAVGTSAKAVWMLFSAAGLLLLIACVNVAGMVVTRGLAKEHELAVRVSLGASRGQVIIHLLGETLWLATVGGIVGVALAYGALGPTRSLIPRSLASMGTLHLDMAVLGFAVAATVFTGLTAGFVPAWRIGREASQGQGGVGATLRVRGGTRARGSVLVGLQFALSTMLVIGAGLMGRSLIALYNVELGIRYAGVTSFAVSLPRNAYTTPEGVAAAFDGIVDGLTRHRSVMTAAAVSHLPLSGARLSSSIRLEGQGESTGSDAPSASIKIVTPSYFEAVGVPVLAGRVLQEADDGGAVPVVVVNRRAAETLWPGEDALGKALAYTNNDGRPVWRRVVGVVGNVRYAGPMGEAEPEVYQPVRQTTQVWGWVGQSMSLLVRTRDGRPFPLAAARNVVATVDPTLPVMGVRTLENVLASTLGAPRFRGILLSTFAALALLLAAVGLHGVAAFAVRRRRRDIGLRMALGARPTRVAGRILQTVLRPAAIGCAVGIGMAALLAHVFSSFVWGVESTDPLTYLGTLAFMITVALLSTGAPALSATRVDPVETLGAE